MLQWKYRCNIFQQTKWKQQTMFESWFWWRETSISMDVCFEAKRKLRCQTTYAAVGVQSSKDYLNANANDSGRGQSLSLRQNLRLYIWTQRDAINLAHKSNETIPADLTLYPSLDAFISNMFQISSKTVQIVHDLLRYNGKGFKSKGRPSLKTSFLENQHILIEARGVLASEIHSDSRDCQ